MDEITQKMLQEAAEKFSREKINDIPEVPVQKATLDSPAYFHPRTYDEKFEAMKNRKKTVPDMLHEAADTYRQRAEVYGDNYKRFGYVIGALFPDGVTHLKKPGVDWNSRYGLLMQMVSKLTRYCENFNKGGHDDSLQDLAVYATMLRELDKEINEVPF